MSQAYTLKLISHWDSTIFPTYLKFHCQIIPTQEAATLFSHFYVSFSTRAAEPLFVHRARTSLICCLPLIDVGSFS